MFVNTDVSKRPAISIFIVEILWMHKALQPWILGQNFPPIRRYLLPNHTASQRWTPWHSYISRIIVTEVKRWGSNWDERKKCLNLLRRTFGHRLSGGTARCYQKDRYILYTSTEPEAMVATFRSLYYYFFLLLLSLLSPLCRMFKVVYQKQTTFLRYTVLQMFCIYCLCSM